MERSSQVDARRVAPLDPLEIAEAIVRGHEEFCVGHVLPEEPYCSCAPKGYPLCAPCAKLVNNIAKAIGEAQRIPAPPDAPQE